MSAGRAPATRAARRIARFFAMLEPMRDDLDRRETECRVRFLAMQGVSSQLAEDGITHPTFIPRAAVLVQDLEALKAEADALVAERQHLNAAMDRAEHLFNQRAGVAAMNIGTRKSA